MADRAYSTLFACLHNEAAPVGQLGRGTHYSVCRAVTGLDGDLSLLIHPHVHDFAIVWDEDHDERVIPVIEGLLLAGLLSPVLFIGERKGNLTVVVDDALFSEGSVNEQSYAEQVEKICEKYSGGDYWPAQVVTLERTAEGLQGTDLSGLVNDGTAKVLAYLNGINALWNLGVRPGRPDVKPA